MSAVTVWGVTYLMHSMLLVAVVAIAARFIRSASVRDTLWKVALIGGIVTATLQVLAPVERILPKQVPQRMQVTMPSPAPAPVVANAPVAAKQPRIDRTMFAEIAYALIALLLLARISVGRRRFLAAVGDRTEILRGPERELLDALAARARCTKAIRLSASESMASPVAMLGWEIVIPSDTFARLSAEQQETILAHELGHLLRRDPLWLTLAEAVKALLFFQPLNWLTSAKMKEIAEFLCDDAAVLQTGNQRALAETLAELASNLAPAPPAVAAMAEGGSSLIVRVQRVLRAHPSAPLHVTIRFAIALVVLCAMALFAPAFGIVKAATRTVTREQANDFSDATLRQKFEGPYGETRVKFVAHEAQVALDGSWVRFNTPDGYVRVDQDTDRGSMHIEVVPGPSLEPKYRYIANGEEKPWCDDARRAMISGFLAEEAYDGADTHKSSTWAANYSRTEDDGSDVKAQIMLEYDDKTGALDVNNNTIVQVIETSAAGKRSFVFDPRGGRWTGSWSGVRRESWLRRILKDAGASDKVVDAILNY